MSISIVSGFCPVDRRIGAEVGAIAISTSSGSGSRLSSSISEGLGSSRGCLR